MANIAKQEDELHEMMERHETAMAENKAYARAWVARLNGERSLDWLDVGSMLV